MVTDSVPTRRTVALIGSFRQHMEQIAAVAQVAEDGGWAVTSPLSSRVIDGSVEFVRLSTDAHELDDPTVQVIALHRILGAELVYVVNVDGYVGRTTCYEIGRIVQAGRPLYFMEPPRDLPIAVPDRAVGPLGELIARLGGQRAPTWWGTGDDRLSQLERSLLADDYLDL